MFLFVFLIFVERRKIPTKWFLLYLNENLTKTRLHVLDYLDKNPWIKFKPNIEVDIKPIAYRGDDFNYSWKTDSLGFKNREDLANLGEYTSVAIGDSAVEAMGVPVDKTWSSLLTNLGFPTYNLGVQGYSPQQITASLKEYGSNFETKYVIYGYTVGFESRTLHFVNFTDGKRLNYTGAVEAINKFSQEQEILANRPFSVINAMIDFYENTFFKHLIFDPSKNRVRSS